MRCMILERVFAAALLWAIPGGAAVYEITAYGAQGDRSTNNAAAIQKAIDAASSAGGGYVQVPRGDFLTGTIVLKSNVILRLAPGATLWGSRRIEDYAPQHLIYARDAENIGIEGPGTINGQGEAFWTKDFKPLKRPSPLIELVGCRNVRIQNVALRNAPGWTIRPKNCDGVLIRGITLVNNMRGLNTDGIDPDSSRNVIISDSYLEAGDDCIVLKTTRRDAGPVLPCENVTVTNCVLVSSASALKLGTESHADFRHVVFSNCVIRGSRTGLAIFAKDGATFENVSFSNITIQTAPKFGVGHEWPIIVDLEKRAPDSRLSRVRNVSFNDIFIESKGRVLVSGLPERPIEDVAFRNVTMRVVGFEPVEKADKPRGGTSQPVPPGLDFSKVPAAFIFAHARNLTLRDVRVQWDGGEPAPERHALSFAHVDGVSLSGFFGRQAAPGGKLAAISFVASRSLLVTGSIAETGTGTFVSGPREELLLQGNDLRRAKAQ